MNPSPDKVLSALGQEARRVLEAALDEGDRWGYRCYSSYEEGSVVLAHGSRHWKWGDLASKGFLTPLGVAVARLSREGPRKRPKEL